MLTWCSRAVNRIFGSPLAASRTRSSPLGPLSRLGVRYGLGSSAFSLVNGLPSTISFGPPLPSFDRFVGTMPLCDSLSPCTRSTGQHRRPARPALFYWLDAPTECPSGKAAAPRLRGGCLPHPRRPLASLPGLPRTIRRPSQPASDRRR